MPFDPSAAMTARFLAVLAAAFLLSTPMQALAAPILPDFGAATFAPGAPIDNRYFPLIDDRIRTYQGSFEDEGELVTERFVLTDRVGEGPIILGVQTSTQRDQSFEDGLLVEDTLDYYAQDSAGNVWYFGEDVTNFIYDDDGNLIDTNSESAWRAGVNGAQPGFIMPASLTVGFNYFQEFAAADEALDQGTISALGLTMTVPVGTFTDVLRVLETTELDLDAREFKFFAPDFGLIAVHEGLDPNFENPELRVELIAVSQVAEPAALSLLGLGFLAVIARRRFRR